VTLLPWESYSDFMDAHVRVSLCVDGVKTEYLSIVDNGINLNAVVGRVTVKYEGHPRTTDRRMTATELVNYLVEKQHEATDYSSTPSSAVR
jgi:hypothetical protein